MLKKFYIFYNSFVLSFITAIASFKVQWLEMRMNIALIIPISFVIYGLCFWILTKDRDVLYEENKKLTLLIGVFSLGFVLIILRRSIAVVPASIVREGLHLTNISFIIFNCLILLFFILGIALILFFKEYDKKCKIAIKQER